MSRQLDNLKRLFSKMQLRYGDHDELVLQVKQELHSREGVESGFQQSDMFYPDSLPGKAAQRRRDVVSRNLPRSPG